MKYVQRTRISGVLADGIFVPPIVIPFLSVLAILIWVAYKAVMQ
jgi:hypothetical protein